MVGHIKFDVKKKSAGAVTDEVLKKFAVMKAERAKWEPMWNKAAEMCSVDSELFTMDNRGRVKQAVFDSTARNALSCFAASMKSVMVPTTSRWHRLKPVNPELDENPEVRHYLEKATNLLFRMRYAANSNFATESDVLFNQLGIYGHAVWMVEDDIGRGIVYRTIPVKEAYIKKNDRGQLEAVFREYELSAAEAVARFGHKLSSEIRQAAMTTPARMFKFLHAVYERDDYEPKKKDFRGMKYASVHLEMSNKRVVQQGGYRTCPYMAPRFLGIAGSSYGDSPAMQAFYDMLTANEMGKTILRTGQLQANPPILTNMGLIDTNKLGSAGAVIRGGLDNQGKPAAVSMQYGNNLAITVEMQREVRAAIERAFLVPLFQSLTQSKQMTATEVEKRELEKSMLLAPMCERISAEWLTGNIERELDILSNYGVLDEVPEELMYEGAIAIEFESPAVHLQTSEAIMGLYRTIEAASTLAQVNPQVLDIFDTESALRQVADYYGVSMDVVRPEKEMLRLQQRATLANAQALMGTAAQPALTAAMRGLKG
ncbi:MAG: portal protein [Acetobacter sp.]|nr:portal protein [Acetobacter sp.]